MVSDTDGQARIPVADDEQVLCNLISRSLTKRGYIVDTAQDGVETLSKVNEKKYDLLLLDIVMPNKNGIQVLRELKETQPDLAVILITAYAKLETAIEGMKLGADNYLLKPFGSPPEPLLIEVDRTLKKQKLRNENIRLFAELKAANEKLTEAYDKVRQSYSEVLYEKRKVEAIMNQLPAGLCVVDREHKITNFNSTAEEVTHYAAREVIGKDWGAVFHGGDFDPDVIWTQICESNEKFGSFEVSINRKEGDYTILINLDLRIMTDEEGQARGGIITFSDVARV